MTYEDFQQRLAAFGFVATPLSAPQYAICVRDGLDFDSIYGVACDVAAGVRFSRALALHLTTEKV